MQVKLDHVGWITDRPERFEEFWCDALGFQRIKESEIDTSMTEFLFAKSGGAKIRRYRHPEFEGFPDIEIHVFERGLYASQAFDRIGINHICLHTGGPGSKVDFLSRLPDDVTIHVYKNPGGWDNIFVRDYDHNWIELREDLK
jgi:catechol 2,3-dioxygenase-like lactoylglutathione lyase family enzyme